MRQDLGNTRKKSFFGRRCSLTHSHTIARTKYPLKTMREEENDRYGVVVVAGNLPLVYLGPFCYSALQGTHETG